MPSGSLWLRFAMVLWVVCSLLPSNHLAPVFAEDLRAIWSSWDVKHELPIEPAEHQQLIELLIATLQSDDPHVALYATKRLVIESPASTEVARLLVDVIQHRDDYLAPMAPFAWSASLSLEGLEKTAVPILLEALDSEDWFYPANAISLFGEDATPAFQWIEKNLASEDDVRREVALRMISRIGPSADEFAATLISRLESDLETDRECRHWQLIALSKLGPRARPAIPKLVSLIGDEREIYGGSFEESAATALANLDAHSAVQTILNRCHQLRSHQKEAMVFPLMRLDLVSVMPELKKILADDDGSVRFRYKVISNLSGSNDKNAADLLSWYLQYVIQQNKQNRTWLVVHVLEALARLGPTAEMAVETIESLRNHEDNKIAVAAAYAVGCIRKDHRPFAEIYLENLHASKEYEFACRGLMNLPPETRELRDSLTALILELSKVPPVDGDRFPSYELPLSLLKTHGTKVQVNNFVEKLRNHPSGELRLQIAEIQSETE